MRRGEISATARGRRWPLAAWPAALIPALLAGCVDMRPPLKLPKPDMPSSYVETVPPSALATPTIPGGTPGMAPPTLPSPEAPSSSQVAPAPAIPSARPAPAPAPPPSGKESAPPPPASALPPAPVDPHPGAYPGATPAAAPPAAPTPAVTGDLGNPGKYPGSATVAPAAPGTVAPAAPAAASPAAPATTAPAAMPAKADTASGAPPEPWWHQFGSAELDRLVRMALENNHDLAAAMDRIREAQAQAGENASVLLPNIQVAGLGQVQSPVGGPGSIATTPNGNAQRLYEIGLVGSYELDLWGKNRDSQEAALANAQSSIYARDTVAITLVSDVATAYFAYLAADDRIAVAQRNVDNMTNVLRTVNARYHIGEGTAIEIEQQATALAQARATVTPLTLLRQQQLYQLATLVGVNPEALKLAGTTLNGITLPKPPDSVPSDLLAERPDIRSAEAQLVAANATIGVGRAKLLPSFSLTAQEGLGSTYFDTLLQPGHWYYLLAANLAQTVFDYGKTLSEIEFDKATFDERVEAYRQAVLNALRDVEASLAGIQLTALTEQAQLDAWTHARAAYGLTQDAFRLGTSDYLTILDTERQQYTAEDAVVQARLDRLNAAIGLFRGLGGGRDAGERQAMNRPRALIALAAATLVAGCAIGFPEATLRPEADSWIEVSIDRKVALSWTVPVDGRVTVTAIDAGGTDGKPAPWSLTWPVAVKAADLVFKAHCKAGPPVPDASGMIGSRFTLAYADCDARTPPPNGSSIPPDPAHVTVNDRRDVYLSWVRVKPHTIDVEAYDPPADPVDPPQAPLVYGQAEQAALAIARHHCWDAPQPVEPATVFPLHHYAFRYYCGDPAKAGPADGAW